MKVVFIFPSLSLSVSAGIRCRMSKLYFPIHLVIFKKIPHFHNKEQLNICLVFLIF